MHSIISICSDVFYTARFVKKCINCYMTLCEKVIASAAINKQLTLYKRDVLIYFCTMAQWIHDFPSTTVLFVVNLTFQNFTSNCITSETKHHVGNKALTTNFFINNVIKRAPKIKIYILILQTNILNAIVTFHRKVPCTETSILASITINQDPKCAKPFQLVSIKGQKIGMIIEVTQGTEW